MWLLGVISAYGALNDDQWSALLIRHSYLVFFFFFQLYHNHTSHFIIFLFFSENDFSIKRNHVCVYVYVCIYEVCAVSLSLVSNAVEYSSNNFYMTSVRTKFF